MTKIMRPEQVSKELGFTDPAKFRREFSDLVTVVSGMELMDYDLAEARLNSLVDPVSAPGLDHRKKHSRKYSGENLGQVKSQILRLQKSIRKLEPGVSEAREVFEKRGKPADQLNYLQLSESLMKKQKSLMKAEQEYDRIIRERIGEIEATASKEDNTLADQEKTD